MEIKKVLAVVMSMCIVGGTLSCGAPVISQTITAQADAADACFSYDESSGVMYLSGFDTTGVWKFDDMFKDCGELKTLKLGENLKNITEKAQLLNGKGWAAASSASEIVSGEGEYAVIENNAVTTYIRAEKTPPTYPANIRVEYNAKDHRVRFKRDKAEGAEKYGIAVYMAGKWRIQNRNITDTVYTSPKNLLPGRTYKVVIAAKVNGKRDIENAMKNAGTITIK